VKARTHRFVNDAYLSGWKKLEVEANTQEEVRRGVVECKVEEQSARLDARPLFLPQVLPSSSSLISSSLHSHVTFDLE
jgi:hypothetical protein